MNDNHEKKPMMEILLSNGQKRFFGPAHIEFTPFGITITPHGSKQSKTYPYANIIEIVWPGILKQQRIIAPPGR